jgi:hypothetical protein
MSSKLRVDAGAVALIDASTVSRRRAGGDR